MTNHELQEKVLAYIQGLGITLDMFRKADRTESPYPISNRAVSDIARGKFESREVGKFGIMKMKDYYSTKDDQLKND